MKILDSKYIKWKETTSKQKQARIISVALYTAVYLFTLFGMTTYYTIPALNSISDFLLQNINLFKPITPAFFFYFTSVIIIGTTSPVLFTMYLNFKFKSWSDRVVMHFGLDPGLVK